MNVYFRNKLNACYNCGANDEGDKKQRRLFRQGAITMDVSTEEDCKKNSDKYWIYLLRQLFSCSAVMFNLFMFGLYTGAPTVIVPQMRKEANSTDIITPEMASWSSSVITYSAVPWTFILPLLAYRFGRKVVLFLVSVNTLLGSIFFYYSTNIIQLIISEAIQGIIPASASTITIMVVSEYTSPKYRGILLTVKAATLFWGVWVSNAIGTFFHWTNISLVVFVCSIYNLSTIFCCESPYWLATKGRFDECAKVHRWLKGTDEDSEKELSKLISSQKEHLIMKVALNQQIKKRKYNLLDILRYKGFYKAFYYAILPVGLHNFSGKLACAVYAIDIIKEITASEKLAYAGMLILDGVTVFSMYLGCALSKIVTRRKQLIILASVGVAFLYILSIYLYVVNLNFISENKYVSLGLLTGYSITISCGPIVVAGCASAEVAPLRYRSYFFCCVSLASNLIMATVLKISPFIFKNCDTHGAFLFYAISSSFLIFLLYKYLPETKDKTIQEIEEYITKGYHHATELRPLKKLECTQE